MRISSTAVNAPIADIPEVQDRVAEVCVPFFQAKNGWSISYGFAYPDWDPPAAPGEPPDKRGYRGGAGG